MTPQTPEKVANFSDRKLSKKGMMHFGANFSALTFLPILLAIFRFFFSRLNQDRKGGAWCPRKAIAESVKEWVEVNLRETHVVTGIVTQVRRVE